MSQTKITLFEIIRECSDIIIVSDNYRENIEYISKRYFFKEWSISQFYSFDFKMIKSNPLFFKTLLVELSDYNKAEMVLIDDSKSNIKSAEKNGIKGIQFTNIEQLEKDLIG
jgi:HAD superfamily hydrolase (TIGR01509 family)